MGASLAAAAREGKTLPATKQEQSRYRLQCLRYIRRLDSPSDEIDITTRTGSKLKHRYLGETSMKLQVTEIATTLAVVTATILGWGYLVATLANALLYPVA